MLDSCVGVCLALVGCQQLLMQGRFVRVCLALVGCQQLLRQGRSVGLCLTLQFIVLYCKYNPCTTF